MRRTLRPWTRAFAALAFVVTVTAIVALGGCIGSELLTPHVEPGGAVTVQLGGQTFKTTALADTTQDPMVVNGFSPFFTFGLVADTDTAGHAARADLAQSSTSADVTVGTTRTQLEVHASGSGCVAGA